MKRVREYKILEENTLEKIIESVNAQIESGWQPQGGIAMRQSLWGGNVYVQSVVLEETDQDQSMDEGSEGSDMSDDEGEDSVAESEEAEPEAIENDVFEPEGLAVTDMADTAPEEESTEPAQDQSLAPAVEPAPAAWNDIDDISDDEADEADEHTAFCRKYKYEDCNCGPEGVQQGVRRQRNNILTESDDERVGEGVDIQAPSYRYPL